MSKQAASTKGSGAEKSGEAPDFETSLAELEGLVEALESGDLSLAESLERFKRGVELSKHCHEMLDQARQSVEILTRPEDEASAQAFDKPAG
ncbi:exodeoxyribonuclease VII small subunit [Wenzhouxiangella sediminis]|jgi:exodeoxyribonuclease VII small subunit|uniref:Exodeoxyribonuclease 7 small subunit n=1 Tax=Wenzhouxiangella sediminis TaxID=1792836 RepID=A0A3E1KBC5_9GAMM|nr:exodeoxyribonuclease VII small subunit [Wenzhouxiangella sediminis]RFF31911.1 exodeoxyribonuclease VII small subunit [Wenzhouxiangella sediminis]